MAIAFDASSTKAWPTTGATHTWAHTCTGSDRLLVVVGFGDSSSDLVTGITYNSVAMTRVSAVAAASNGSLVYMYYLLAPTTGANNIVASVSNSGVNFSWAAASYTGVKQTGQPDSFATNAGNTSTTSFTLATTTVADNCWLIGAMRNTDNFVAGTNTLIRIEDSGFATISDSNSDQTPAGSKSLNWTRGGAARIDAVTVSSFAPAAAASAIKTINGLAYASVKTVNGLAIASVKTVNGLA